MSQSDLRTRIAAAIEAQHVSEYQGGIHPEDVLRLADAVIRELASTAAQRHAESSSRLGREDG